MPTRERSQHRDSPLNLLAVWNEDREIQEDTGKVITVILLISRREKNKIKAWVICLFQPVLAIVNGLVS